MSITLVNFKVPVSLLERFDALCRLAFKTRTSVLIDMMKEYTLTQAENLEVLTLRYEEVDRILGNFRDLNDWKVSRTSNSENDWIGVQNRSEFDIYEDDDGFHERMMDWDS